MWEPRGPQGLRGPGDQGPQWSPSKPRGPGPTGAQGTPGPRAPLIQLRWRWRRTYLGHLTNRLRSRVGRMSPPTRKFRGVAWKRGSWRFSGAGAGFFFSGSFLEDFLDGIFANDLRAGDGLVLRARFGA